MNTQVADNKVVSITYRIMDEAGNLVEQSDLPVSYVHGAGGKLLPKLEKALEGHDVGDTVEVTVPPEEGFGARDPALTYTDDIDNVPEQYRRVGAEAEFQNDRGERKVFTVTKIEDGKLTLDGNHPLAGKAARFVVQVRGVRDASPEEITRGEPENPFGFDMIGPGSTDPH